MFDLNSFDKVLLYPGSTDMRLGIPGLRKKILIDSNDLELRQLYIFCGKQKNAIKAISIDATGTWLYQKRLAKGKFIWPNKGDKTLVTKEQITWLIDGLRFIDVIENNGQKPCENIVLF